MQDKKALAAMAEAWIGLEPLLGFSVKGVK